MLNPFSPQLKQKDFSFIHIISYVPINNTNNNIEIFNNLFHNNTS